MIALIAVLTLLLLARAFRSLLLPLKAVVLNVISVAAAWGVITLVWQQGHGSNAIFGIAATHSVSAWIPLMVFAFLFGLSMDYEVFILSRMREEFDASGSTDTAVVRGIGRSGRLVTSAALILFLAFVSMASGPNTDVKVFATGLAAGILLDATVIRALLVPAIVSLFGRWNWWLPERPARLLGGGAVVAGADGWGGGRRSRPARSSAPAWPGRDAPVPIWLGKVGLGRHRPLRQWSGGRGWGKPRATMCRKARGADFPPRARPSWHAGVLSQDRARKARLSPRRAPRLGAHLRRPSSGRTSAPVPSRPAHPGASPDRPDPTAYSGVV